MLLITNAAFAIGAIQVLLNGGGGEVVRFSGGKHFEGVRFNVIIVTRGWVRVQFSGKKRYVTLEWPHTRHHELILQSGHEYAHSYFVTLNLVL